MNCTIEGCERPMKARGWCATHWSRWYRHGDPLAGRTLRSPGMNEHEGFVYFMPDSPPPAELEVVDNQLVWLQEGCCWDWRGPRHNAGYGKFSVNGEHVLAHVVSYRIHKGPITADKPYILHWCDRPICVQPAHLHAGTQLDNMAEMAARGRSNAGEKSPFAKITASDVRWIRANPDLPHADMAAKFGISRRTIRDILSHRSWRVA